MKKTIAALRKEYSGRVLDEKSIAADPYKQFERWFLEAVSLKLIEPNACSLATANKKGIPSVRTILIKEFSPKSGFIFFTNYQSRKARELYENNRAALLFFWDDLARQVRIEGKVEKISRRQAVNYWRGRPRGSQLGSYCSEQSSLVQSRRSIEEQYQRCKELYAGKEVPCPKQWGGYALKPQVFEFWQGREDRLHDRLLYSKLKKGWSLERLAP